MALVCTVLFAATILGEPVRCAERELLDGIAAVVGEEIILESELDEELYIYQVRTGQPSIRPDDATRLRGQVLKEMVDEKLLVAMARRDSVQLPPGRLDEEIERRVKELRSRYGTEEQLNEELEAEGVTLEQLEDVYRDDIERRLLAEQVVRTEVNAKIDVTWGDVDRYYDEHGEEVGRIPERYEVAGILVMPRVTEEAKSTAIERMNMVKQKLAEGVPFEELAAEYSDDPSGDLGGDLGFFSPGTMVPEFEDAAFSLGPGEVSGIVPTRFGYHIIEVLEKEDDRVRARHILAHVAPGPEDDVRARARAESVRQMVVDGRDFEDTARQYSDDMRARESGGNLGWFPAGELDPSFKEVLSRVSDGEVAGVVEGENGGYYILKLLAHEQERVASLDEVREDLKDYLFQIRAEAALNGLLDRLSREIYVDIRTERASVE